VKKVEPVKHILKRIYGDAKGSLAFEKILPLIESFSVFKSEKQDYFSQKDVVLITYGDSLNREGEAPLETLSKFSNQYLKGLFSTIHILPFFPYSSDDGFSVQDFFSVNPDLGSWEEIEALAEEFELMYDYVLNHISAQSQWFKRYKDEEPGFEALAKEVDPEIDLSMVTRPRSLPLLTEVTKSSGKIAHVWTTFSADQIDLNYKDIDVLAKMIEVLLFYVQQGARMLRLDAVAYLWKEIGTKCIHLRQTHDMVKLFRKILDVVAPDVIIITETNVPHEENISYFGDGKDEAQMVYNFTLPPLLLHAFIKEDSTVLSQWAKGLRLGSDKTTFFNFTASHDGIGVRPLEGILSKEELNQLVEIVKENGGNVSYKKNPDGSESPYELNITYVDGLRKQKEEHDIYHTQRFIASQAIQYVLPGVPATYIHSLLGSRNWKEGVRKTQRARTINREKLNIENVLLQLKNIKSFRAMIFFPYIKLIELRKRQPALHPNAAFEILKVHPQLFAIARYCEEQEIYTFTNISSKPVSISLKGKNIPSNLKDIFTERRIDPNGLSLKPYQYVWLTNRTR